jgi:hypothetical protein
MRAADVENVHLIVNENDEEMWGKNTWKSNKSTGFKLLQEFFVPCQRDIIITR